MSEPDDDIRRDVHRGGTHAPLPYVVRLRAALTADAVPQPVVHRCTAYSVAEAVQQAVYAVVGSGVYSGDASTCVVEDVQPDVGEYWLMLVRQVADRKVGAKR